MDRIELRIVHAQNDRWFVVDRRQNPYGKPGGYATEAEAEAVRAEWIGGDDERDS